MSYIVSYGIGSIIGLIVVLTLLFWLVRVIVQKKHSVLRNHPLIGRLRYFLENQGEYIRQYFIGGERDQMPFNRAARNWVYRTAKGVGGVIGFGSTNDPREPGSIIFVNAQFQGYWKASSLQRLQWSSAKAGVAQHRKCWPTIWACRSWKPCHAWSMT